MGKLLQFPRAKSGQSLNCYLRLLANRNGFKNTEHMLKSIYGDSWSASAARPLSLIEDLTGLAYENVGELGLIPSEQHDQPCYWLGSVAIPSYHLVRDEWVCPQCVEKIGYVKSIWRVAWLPCCTEHRCSLIRLEKDDEAAIYKQNSALRLASAANEDLYDLRVFEVQTYLEVRLHREMEGNYPPSNGKSVVTEVDEYIRRCIGEKRFGSLQFRQRKYSKRFSPFNETDAARFMECLHIQMMA